MNENNDITTNGMDWENSGLAEGAQRAAGMVSQVTPLASIEESATENALIKTLQAASQEIKLNLVVDESTSDPTIVWAKVLGGYTEYINKELQAIIDNAKEVLTYLQNTSADALDLAKLEEFGLTEEQAINLKNNAEELAAAYETIQNHLNQFGDSNPFTDLIQHAKALQQVTVEVKNAQAEVTKSGDDNTNTFKKVMTFLNGQKSFLEKDLKESVKTASAYLTDLGSSFQSIGKAAGNAGLESVGKALSDIGSIGNTLAEKGPIAAGITAITTGLTAIFSSSAKYNATLKQVQKERISFLTEYNKALFDQALKAKELSNVFAEDKYAKAVNSLELWYKKVEEYKELINKKDTLQFSDSWLGKLKKASKEAQGITTDLENIWIQTRHKTLLRSAKGMYLKDMYPELFKDESGFNVMAAKKLLQTNNMLDDYAKEQIQNVINTYDQWQQAEEEFKSYLNNTFGEIGAGFANSIVTAFENGTDAMEKWADNFNNVIKNLGKQLMQTLFFQKKFDELQKQLTDLYDFYGDKDDKTKTNKLGAEVTKLMGSFFNQMSTVSKDASAWYEDWTKQAANAGFDLGGAGSATVAVQSATSGGFQAMTQDTGDELNGRFTAIQGSTVEIQNMVGEMKGLSLISINHLANIEKNTHELYGIATDIRAIKKNTENL